MFMFQLYTYIQCILGVGINLLYTHTGTYARIFHDSQKDTPPN